MPFQIVRNDITKIKADAIVNTANPKPVIGGGTDSAIYEAAGEEELLQERKKIGEIMPGEAVETPAFHLQAQYIIHTVGPAWIDGNHHEIDILHKCYRNSLKLAGQLGCRSIAFPLIATGVYGFPKDKALSIALEEINTFLLANEKMKVTLVVFDRKSFVLSGERFGDLQAYIDENYVGKQSSHEYSKRGRARRELEALEYEERLLMSEAEPDYMEDASDLELSLIPEGSLDEVLNIEGQTFQQRLLELIDASGMKDSEFYRDAGITKQVFSTIRSNENYQPKKETAVASALALQLNISESEDLLERAGYAFSPTSKFDVIVRYCIEHKIYRIMEVNEALFKYGQKTMKI